MSEISRIFADKNAKGVVLGATTSSLATLSFSAALSMYIMDLTGSAIDLSFTLLIGMLPFVLFSLIAGVVCDRFDRKRIFISADLIRVALGICLLVALPLVPREWIIWVINVVVFLFATLEVFVVASFNSILPEVVKKDKLVDVNNILNGFKGSTQLVAPVVGVSLYAFIGISATITMLIICYFLSYIFESKISYQQPPRKSNETIGTIIKQEMQGFKSLITNDVRILSLNINGFATHLVMLPFLLIGLPYLITQVFKGSTVEYGIVEMFAAAGGLLSVLLVPKVKHLGNSKNLMLGMFGMLVGVALFTLMLNPSFSDILSNSQWLRVSYFSVANFIIFLSFGFYGVFFVSFLQQNIEPAKLGKGMAVQIMFIGTGRLLGFSFFGFLFTQSLETATTVLILGILAKFIIHIPFIIADRKKNRPADDEQLPQTVL